MKILRLIITCLLLPFCRVWGKNKHEKLKNKNRLRAQRSKLLFFYVCWSCFPFPYICTAWATIMWLIIVLYLGKIFHENSDSCGIQIMDFCVKKCMSHRAVFVVFEQISYCNEFFIYKDLKNTESEGFDEMKSTLLSSKGNSLRVQSFAWDIPLILCNAHNIDFFLLLYFLFLKFYSIPSLHSLANISSFLKSMSLFLFHFA